MVNNVLGMLIGAEIGSEDGGSEVGGALEGYLIEGAIKTLTPLVVTFAIGWTVRYIARRAFAAIAAD